MAPGSRPSGFTIVEMLIVLSVIAVILAISIPLVLRMKVGAHEASAISSLRTLHDAQEVFRSTCGRGTLYAASLPQLGAAQMISPDLAVGPIVSKSGYLLTLVTDAVPEKIDTCTGGPLSTHWYASAVPQVPGMTGDRGFATAVDQDIWRDLKGTAPPEPFQAGDTVAPLENGR